MPKGDKLSAKQANFVREYLLDFNSTAAAARSGYSPKTSFAIGRENLQKPIIQKAIAEYQNKIAEKAEIKVEDIIGRLSQLGFDKLEGDVVQHKDQIKSLELLGKYLGIFTTSKVELTGVIDVTSQDAESVRNKLLTLVEKI